MFNIPHYGGGVPAEQVHCVTTAGQNIPVGQISQYALLSLSTWPNMPSGHMQSRYDEALKLTVGAGQAVMMPSWHW